MSKRGASLVPAVITLMAMGIQLSSDSGRPGSVIYFPRPDPERCDVFVSYHEEDRRFRNELDPHLADLRDNNIKIHTYDTIDLGTYIREETKNALRSAAVAVLLIGQSYIASSLKGTELRNLLRQAERGGTVILTVYTGVVDNYSLDKLTRYKPIGGKPLNELRRPQRQHVYVEIVQAARKRLKEVRRYPG
jgi:TIR domain